ASDTVVRTRRAGDRPLGVEGHDRVQPRVAFGDAIEMGLHHVARGDVARPQALRRLGRTEIAEAHGRARTSSAAETPPRVNGTPAAARPISTPLSVPASIRSLK